MKQPETPLFRLEAASARFSKLPGKLIVRTPRFLNLSVYAFLLTVIAAASVFLLSNFSKKEVASGRLVPSLGLVKVIPGVNGILEELKVAQGNAVKQGQVLAVVASESAQYGGKQAVLAQINSTKQSLNELAQQIAQEQQESEIKATRLQGKIDGFKAQIEAQNSESDLRKNNIKTLKRAAEAGRKLAEDKVLAPREADERENKLREAELQLSALNREIVSLQVEITQTEADLKILPKELDLTLSKLKQQQLEAAQKITSLEAQLHYEVIAPRDGTIDYLAFQQGQPITTSASLLSIVPKDSPLHAEVFAPVKSITSIKPGQSIRFDYAPFPASRFGFATGKIISVNQTVLDPDELKAFGFNATAPVYRIIAALDNQAFKVDGQNIPLRAGISFTSDIIVEQHPLWRWAYQYATEAWNAR